MHFLEGTILKILQYLCNNGNMWYLPNNMILFVDNNINYYGNTIRPPKPEHNPAQPNRVRRSSQNATQRPISLSLFHLKIPAVPAAIMQQWKKWLRSCVQFLKKKIHHLWPQKRSFFDWTVQSYSLPLPQTIRVAVIQCIVDNDTF